MGLKKLPTAQETPAIPKTSVEDTKAPGGVAPVRPAAKRLTSSSTDDKMTKADWSNKDRAIENQTIAKAVLGSPLLATLAMTKTTSEQVNEFIRQEFAFMRDLLDEAKK